MRTGKHPCIECPFRKQSMKGWLGPWKSAQELLEHAFSELGLACHMQLDRAHEVGGAPVCTGSLVCANKSHKIYRDNELRKLQEKVKNDPGVLDAQGFLAHHKTRIQHVGRSYAKDT